ncbi:MAG: ATP-dependent protease subunit HslV [Chloroflexota bacterium]|nr:ATP-dependent protease subunit HslV [Chloroflexota bacterium]
MGHREPPTSSYRLPAAGYGLPASDYRLLASRYRVRSTTIVAVRAGGEVAIAGDGQVTVNDMVMKRGANKLRRLFKDQVLAGFAGSVADALTLFDKFEAQLEKHGGNTRRAAVELTREWRSDRFLRRLEAQLLVADPDNLLVLSGEGDVIEPDDHVAAIGSGGGYATAAAKALLAHSSLSAADIAQESLKVAAELCVYTNDRITIEVLAPHG